MREAGCLDNCNTRSPPLTLEQLVCHMSDSATAERSGAKNATRKGGHLSFRCPMFIRFAMMHTLLLRMKRIFLDRPNFTCISKIHKQFVVLLYRSAPLHWRRFLRFKGQICANVTVFMLPICCSSNVLAPYDRQFLGIRGMQVNKSPAKGKGEESRGWAGST